MATDLLPPNATSLERALSTATARIGDVPCDLGALWNPATCPSDLLPWLAWALSIDRWSVAWSDAQRRAAIATAIEDQRRKGTPATMRRVLGYFDDLLELVEWFAADPPLPPHTFEVRLPLLDRGGVAGGDRVSADFARAIASEVAAAKPVRAHFALVQTLAQAGAAGIVQAAQATLYRRLDLQSTAPAAMPWAALLQDENGEPLEDDTGATIDGDPA